MLPAPSSEDKSGRRGSTAKASWTALPERVDLLLPNATALPASMAQTVQGRLEPSNVRRGLPGLTVGGHRMCRPIQPTYSDFREGRSQGADWSGTVDCGTNS